MAIGRIVMPGWSIGTSSIVIPRCRGAPGSLRTSMKIQFAVRASDVQIFWPSITHVSPSSRARVRSPARSDPAPGSEKPWHQRSSPLTMRGRNRRFCSSVPWRSSRLPIILIENTSFLPLAGTPALANSSARTTCCSRVRPAPPYSRGQLGVR